LPDGVSSELESNRWKWFGGRGSRASQGIGSRLYKTLIEDLRARRIQVVLGGIAQPNQASVGLHERLGFEKVAHFRRVGRKFEQWIDVGYWELQLG
jgi:L-amino acid N-acyltransferase YncA